MSQSSQGMSLFELLIVLALIGILAVVSVPSLLTLQHNEQSNELKSQLIHALMLTKAETMATHDTLAFCVGHDNKCASKPITSGLLYADIFHDGILHDNKQILSHITFPAFQGALHFRSFPHYRSALLFKGRDWVESDNGTFWLCLNKSGKPQWGITINRFAMIHDLTANAKGDILDAKGQALTC